MKNPIRLLCTAIGGLHRPKAGLVRPLVAAGGLCAAAVLVLVWADESLERYTPKQTAHPSGEKSSSEHPNTNTRAADPARALAQAFTLEPGSEQESRIRDLLSAWAAQDAEAALITNNGGSP